MKSIRIHQPGGPEEMQFEDLTLGEPECGEVPTTVFVLVFNETLRY